MMYIYIKRDAVTRTGSGRSLSREGAPGLRSSLVADHPCLALQSSSMSRLAVLLLGTSLLLLACDENVTRPLLDWSPGWDATTDAPASWENVPGPDARPPA